MQKWGEERIFPHPNIYYRTDLFISTISLRVRKAPALFKGGLELLMHLKGAPLASKINIPIVVAGLEQLFHLTFRRFTGIGRGAGI